jgi:hypothetical protein
LCGFGRKPYLAWVRGVFRCLGFCTLEYL